MRAGNRFAADVRTFLDHMGATGLPLTDTRRLRLADVREINSRLVEPEELDQRIGERIFRMRTEDEAWRVSFMRLAGDKKIAQDRFADFRARMKAIPRRPPRAAGHDAPPGRRIRSGQP